MEKLKSSLKNNFVFRVWLVANCDYIYRTLNADLLEKNFSQGLLFFCSSQRLSRKAKSTQISQTMNAV